jgi:hypothetical protein
MPPVCHLYGTRCGTSRGIRVDAVAIAADHFASWMVGHPLDERVPGWILQQIDNPMSLRIHENRAVSTAAT